MKNPLFVSTRTTFVASVSEVIKFKAESNEKTKETLKALNKYKSNKRNKK